MVWIFVFVFMIKPNQSNLIYLSRKMSKVKDRNSDEEIEIEDMDDDDTIEI